MKREREMTIEIIKNTRNVNQHRHLAELIEATCKKRFRKLAVMNDFTLLKFLSDIRNDIETIIYGGGEIDGLTFYQAFEDHPYNLTGKIIMADCEFSWSDCLEYIRNEEKRCKQNVELIKEGFDYE